MCKIKATPYPKPLPGYPIKLPIPYSRAIALGLISGDHYGSQRICPHCGSTRIESTVTSRTDWIVEEEDIRCGRCQAYLGHAAYGMFDPVYAYPDSFAEEHQEFVGATVGGAKGTYIP